MKANELKLTQLFLEHHGFIRRCALRFAPMPGLVDDIVQQVFVDFVSKADRWDIGEDVKPLLAVITRNIALQHWHQYKQSLPDSVQKVAEHLKHLAEGRETPDSYNEDMEALDHCLDQLSEKGRFLIRQYYYEQKPTEALGNLLKMKPGAVNRSICRLREKLAQCIRLTLQREEVR